MSLTSPSGLPGHACHLAGGPEFWGRFTGVCEAS